MTVVWRKATKDGPHTPLVIVLHGRGADETDLLPVIERLPRALSYASLRALVPVAGGGFTWFENRGAARPIAKSLRASSAQIRAWLDELTPPATQRPVFLAGFSAGMMMAGALMLDDPARFAGAVLLSGALPLDSGLDAEDERLRGKPVFYARGERDDVIPADLVARSEAYLRERSGAVLTARMYDHDHSISVNEIRDIAAWFAEHV